jgi:hypothetical protein
MVAVVVLVGLVVLFYVEEDWRGARAWQTYKAQQIARGAVMDRAALVPAAVPEDENFAATPFLAPLFDFVPGTQRTRDPDASEHIRKVSLAYDAAASTVEPKQAARSNSWVTGSIDLPAWQAAFLKGSNAAPLLEASHKSGSRAGSKDDSDAAAVILSALADSDAVIEELRSASSRPCARFNVQYDNDDPAAVLLPHYATLKRVCQILQLRAAAELALGRTDQAFEDTSLIFRLIDTTREEPILIGYLVRIAELHLALQPLAEGLAKHQWTDSQLRSFEERLLDLDICASGRRALEGERVIFGSAFIDYLRNARHKADLFSNLGADGGDGKELPGLLLAAMPSGWFDLEKVNYNRMFEEYFLPAIDAPGHRVSPETCRKTETRLNATLAHPWPVVLLHHEAFSRFLLPALSRAVERTAFAQTAADMAALACALERYRLARGRYPEPLEALAPEFITRQPRDVINGQPLKYARTGDGQYVLYSVGWNETDDGGVVGLSKSGKNVDLKTGDWVWRLPNPPNRD